MARSRRSAASKLRLLISLTLAATAAFPPSAAAQLAAARPPLPLAALPPLAQLGELGRELQLHLDGRRPARLEAVSAGLDAVEARLAAGLPASDEPSLVRAELGRVRALLGRAAARASASAPAAFGPRAPGADGASALLRA
ncbi:MAG: hypothetical protein NDJ72_13515, partial [Elusimicrobia bacterium]|nr:hypothetical protein [Elusimicrobiota bacterium]